MAWGADTPPGHFDGSMRIILPGWTRVNGQTTGRCRARKLQPWPGSPPGGRSQPGHPPKASAGLLIRSGRARRTVLVHSVRLVVVVVKLPPQGSSHSGPTDRPSLAARLPADQAQPSDAVGTDAGAPMVPRPDLLEWLHDQRTAPGSPGGHDAGQRAGIGRKCAILHIFGVAAPGPGMMSCRDATRLGMPSWLALSALPPTGRERITRTAGQDRLVVAGS